MAEGGTCHNTKRKRLSEARLLSRDGRGRDLSGHGKKAPNKGHALAGDGRGWYLSGKGKKETERGTLTS